MSDSRMQCCEPRQQRKSNPPHHGFPVGKMNVAHQNSRRHTDRLKHSRKRTSTTLQNYISAIIRVMLYDEAAKGMKWGRAGTWDRRFSRI